MMGLLPHQLVEAHALDMVVSVAGIVTVISIPKYLSSLFNSNLFHVSCANQSSRDSNHPYS